MRAEQLVDKVIATRGASCVQHPLSDPCLPLTRRGHAAVSPAGEARSGGQRHALRRQPSDVTHVHAPVLVEREPRSAEGPVHLRAKMAPQRDPATLFIEPRRTRQVGELASYRHDERAWFLLTQHMQRVCPPSFPGPLEPGLREVLRGEPAGATRGDGLRERRHRLEEQLLARVLLRERARTRQRQGPAQLKGVIHPLRPIVLAPP